MPWAKPCATPGCGRLIAIGTRWCTTHQRAQEAQDRARRGSASSRGYDRRWARYRLAYLAEHPLCVECQAPASVVDHVEAHKGDHRLFWMPSNHRAMCKRCHDARVDEGDFGR